MSDKTLFQTPGYKDDSEKARAGLVLQGFGGALIEVAKVGTFGARKYTDYGWTQVENGQARYIDAAFRHLLDRRAIDSESGLTHLAHAAWNLLAALEFYLCDQQAKAEQPPGVNRDE